MCLLIGLDNYIYIYICHSTLDDSLKFLFLKDSQSFVYFVLLLWYNIYIWSGQQVSILLISFKDQIKWINAHKVKKIIWRTFTSNHQVILYICIYAHTYICIFWGHTQLYQGLLLKRLYDRKALKTFCPLILPARVQVEF